MNNAFYYLENNSNANKVLEYLNNNCEMHTCNCPVNIFSLANEFHIKKHELKKIFKQMCKLNILVHISGHFDKREYHINNDFIDKTIRKEKAEIPDYSELVNIYNF